MAVVTPPSRWGSARQLGVDACSRSTMTTALPPSSSILWSTDVRREGNEDRDDQPVTAQVGYNVSSTYAGVLSPA